MHKHYIRYNLWRLREEVQTLPQAVKALVRKLPELRSKITNSANERRLSTDCEPAPSAGRRQAQTRLTPDEVAKLVAGYRAGRSMYQLAVEFKIARQTVSEHLHRHGVPMRRKGLTDDQLTEAIRLRKQGLTLKTISDHFDVCIDTVRDRMRRRGVATDRPLC